MPSFRACMIALGCGLITHGFHLLSPAFGFIVGGIIILIVWLPEKK